MGSMEDKKGTGVVVIGIALFLVAVFYVLSWGPVGWLAQHGYVPVQWWATIYYPITAIAQASDWINEALEWYLHWWVV